MGLKRGEKYARVGVVLRTHSRAHEAGWEAMAVYAFCQLQARAEERDGAFGVVVVVNGCWGMPAAKVRKCLSRLVEVGLLVALDRPDEMAVARYGEWNETTDEIGSRRSATNERVTRFRGALKRVTNASVPDSDSVSVSDLDRKRDPESQAGEPAPALAAVRVEAETQRDGVFGMTSKAWREGVGETTRQPVAALSRFEVRDLQALCAAHLPTVRGTDLLAAVRALARDYARHELADCEARFGLTPRRCSAWLTAGRPAPAQRSGARIVQPVPATGRAWTVPEAAK